MPAVRRCPSLGLDDDQYTCMTFATESHHCYRLARHKAIPLDHQSQYCLNENHIRCPIFLSGDRLFPKVAKSQGIPLQTSKVPSNKATGIPKSAVKWMIVIAAILVLALGSWLVYAKTDIFTRPDPPVQAFGELPPGITPGITRTQQEFAPNQTLIYELTATASETSTAQPSQPIPVTGQVTATRTSTLTSTPTPTPSPTAIACSLPEGWIVYNVKLWDTLYWLSLSVRTSMDYLMEVNCLSSQLLVVGQEIYLPYYPPKASHTPTKTPTPTPTDIPATRTYTPTPTRTQTPIPTHTYSPTPTRTYTPTPTGTPTNIVIPTHTPTATPTHTPTDMPIETPTFTPTNTPTDVPPTDPPPPTEEP